VPALRALAEPAALLPALDGADGGDHVRVVRELHRSERAHLRALLAALGVACLPLLGGSGALSTPALACASLAIAL